MAGWVKAGNLRGPEGPEGQRGPQGEAGTPNYNVIFPVGSVVRNTNGSNPTIQYGGTWVQRPSLGAFAFERVR